ncbi:MAG: ABC transporter ATP-binding protein [Pseudomonadota bacterium]|jgi:branched-chain amino acid transport system ATP-binding protein|uniref:ABC transporter ATP-binding protein n=1 Tax=Thalassovita sp. TaxID=1979401 RepID=UPI002AB053FA|nr:ABC transporter ATP-binding protein [Thalassovita sp.]MEC7963343.1 ABC transporter ATP-binding protein [Pseudomonadota bacterium]MEC8294485.1 ABC transporter ATP-binding protein [Pseudomonadota bacterium]
MTQTLLETQALTVRFGGHVAVDAVSCSFHAGELTAIVGPNGAGKTTYFNLISGQIPASAGTVKLMGEDITRLGVADRCRRGLGRAFQLTNLFPSLSVLENVRLVIQSRQHKGFGLFSMADSHTELTVAAMAILERVRLDHQKDQLVSELSHGDQRKLEVALLLGLDPMVYMFDEPTAGMSVDEAPVILDLIAEIKADRERTVLLVEHKMDVIRTLADRIIVLHNGALAADGDPETVMASDVVQEAYMGKELDHV